MHEDWSDPPTICKSCRENRKSKWYDKRCAGCGTIMHIHEDWDNPPEYCKSCKAKRKSKWYDVRCAECGTIIHVHRDWGNPPKYCKSCKAARDRKWTTKACEKCRAPIRIHIDWDNPPKICDKCKRDYYSPKTAICAHCGKGFTISTGLQLKCEENGWDLPKRCDDCRELFRHKPFRTQKETDMLGNVVFRIYNNRGVLISESRDYEGLLDKKRIHYGRKGKIVAETRRREDVLGNRYRETTTRKGERKSISRDYKDVLGNEYTDSVGGTSKTKHRTWRRISWLGRKYSETE